MCDVLVTADGIELGNVGDAHRYGIAIPAALLTNPIHGDRHCLCGVGIDELLAKHHSTWRRGAGLSGRGWSEVGPDGRTWWDGYDIETCGPDYPDQRSIRRSDGRAAMTLDQWEDTHV